MPLHIVTEAERCLNCKKPLCQEGCPVHTPIPEIIQLFKQHKLMEAGEKLFANNPLSAVCAAESPSFRSRCSSSEPLPVSSQAGWVSLWLKQAPQGRPQALYMYYSRYFLSSLHSFIGEYPSVDGFFHSFRLMLRL